jgi:hypothetical protein
MRIVIENDEQVVAARLGKAGQDAGEHAVIGRRHAWVKSNIGRHRWVTPFANA